MRRKTVGIGLIGTGFMGRCHANAFRSVAGLFDLPLRPQPVMLADADVESARWGAQAMGFERFTGDWQTLVDDAQVGIVAITAPNALHEAMALAAIRAGKTVYCEKPLSVSADSASRMTEAAEQAGVVNLVGFNFLCNPMIRLAKQIIDAGELGAITGFRGRHAENYMADPQVAHSFRTDPSGGGALMDIGSHIVSLIRYLLGPVSAVSAVSRTIHARRPVRPGARDTRAVRVDDLTHALLELGSGVVGSLEANWAATARTMDLSFEISGSWGALAFTQERMNELLVYTGDVPGRQGYTRIEAGPRHPPYERFCPAPGHHLGYNDLKTIEVAELIRAHAGGVTAHPDFREALAVQRVIEAMQASAAERSWVAIPPGD